MTRTQLLQEIRRMRFVEAYVGWQARRLNQREAVSGPRGGGAAGLRTPKIGHRRTVTRKITARPN